MPAQAGVLEELQAAADHRRGRPARGGRHRHIHHQRLSPGRQAESRGRAIDCRVPCAEERLSTVLVLVPRTCTHMRRVCTLREQKGVDDSLHMHTRTQKTLGHREASRSRWTPTNHVCHVIATEKNRREATLLQHKQVTIRPCARAPRAPPAHGHAHGHGSWPRPAGMR